MVSDVSSASPAPRSWQRATLWRKRVLGWPVVMLLVGLTLWQLPLFGVLGYEHALATAVVAAIMGVDVGAAIGRHRVVEVARWPSTGLATPLGSLATAVAAAVVIALIPGLLAAVRGRWVTTCDWRFGGWAYLLMPLASATVAATWGHTWGIWIGPRRVIGTLVPLAALLGTALVGLWRFYAAPPVFTFNPLVGFFPGNMYDEHIVLDTPVLWSRLEDLLWLVAAGAGTAIALGNAHLRPALPPAWRQRSVAIAAAVTVIAGAGAGVMHARGGALGYLVDSATIEAVLAGRIETPHFVISYAHTPEIDRDIQLIAADHEFRLAQVVAVLGVRPGRKIHSYYFASSEQKAQFFGARDVEMAKPWRHEIYLDHRDFPHGSLRHEIAHVVAAEFGDGLFGVASRRVLGLPLLANPGLIEGLAVAADWPGTYERSLSPDESVRVMQELGALPQIGDLFSLRFLAASSTRGYQTAGSFIHFLLVRFGAEKMRALYASGGDFTAAYGTSLADLAQQWRAHVADVPIAPEIVAATQERFRRGGFFSVPCPHANATRQREAYAALGRGDRVGGIALLRELCADDPAEPSRRIQLADILDVGTPAEKQEAVELWSAVLASKATTVSLRVTALSRLATAAFRAGDHALARRHVEAAIALAPDEDQRRTLDAKRLALTTTSPAKDALTSYLFDAARLPGSPTWPDIAVARDGTSGFAFYLRGLARQRDHDDAGATTDLEAALQLGLPDRRFVRNAGRKLAIAGWRHADRAAVTTAIATLRGPGASEMDGLLADDWQQRLDFVPTR